MRKLLSALFLLMLFQVPAQAQETAVIISPVYPVNCEVDDYSMVNWIWNIKKVREDEKTVAFSFSVQYGRCQNKKVVPYKMDANQASVMVYKKEFCILCRKEPAKVQYTVISDTEMSVLMEVNKKFAFEKGNQRSLQLNFIPFYQRQMYNYNGAPMMRMVPFIFPWNVDLYHDDGTEIFIH